MELDIFDNSFVTNFSRILIIDDSFVNVYVAITTNCIDCVTSYYRFGKTVFVISKDALSLIVIKKYLFRIKLYDDFCIILLCIIL